MTVDVEGWEPGAGWRPLPGAAGGAWLVVSAGRELVVKRLTAPVPGDPPALRSPGHVSYWRREADVALSATVRSTHGLRGPEVHRVEEDPAGVAIWSSRVADAGNNGLYLARALGRFAQTQVPDQPWLTRGLLAARLGLFEARNGWPTLARTTLADVADRLWARRGHFVSLLEGLPQVLSHGDPTPANLLGRDGAEVVAVDWSTLGTSAVGADVGYLALSAREGLDVLLDAYAEGIGTAGIGAEGMSADREQVRLGATVMAGYTALCRAEWALGRAARGPGALAGKYRHPTVAPYLRSLQRLFPALETLL